MRFMREPLLHFALIGGLLFALYTFVGPNDGVSGDKVVVGREVINNLRLNFQRTRNRVPTEEELVSLIDDYVMEEIFYRQALAMGLDKNDQVIRQHLRRKMEFLATDTTQLLQPDDQILQEYLDQHPEKFHRDSTFSFDQIYINTDGNPVHIQTRVDELKQQVEASGFAQGDLSALPPSVDDVMASQIDRTFGQGFAASLEQLPINMWSQPVRSGMGLHLVKISAYRPGYTPPLSEIHDSVEREWLNEKNQEIQASLLEELSAQYQIEVEWPNTQPRGVGG